MDVVWRGNWPPLRPVEKYLTVWQFPEHHHALLLNGYQVWLVAHDKWASSCTTINSELVLRVITLEIFFLVFVGGFPLTNLKTCSPPSLHWQIVMQPKLDWLLRWWTTKQDFYHIAMVLLKHLNLDGFLQPSCSHTKTDTVACWDLNGAKKGKSAKENLKRYQWKTSVC